MAPRLDLRTCSHRLSSQYASRLQFHPTTLAIRFKRTITSDEKPLPESDSKSPGPNQDQLPHVSEEAAATSKITGETGPAIDQGTPVKDVLERDSKAKDSAPQILKEESKATSPKGSRSFSTSSRRAAEVEALPVGPNPPTPMGLQRMEGSGLLFHKPELPIQSGLHLKRRYEPIVEQVTKLMMKDGKLSIAQRTMTLILERLRTAQPPQTNPLRPLIPGTPPPAHLPLNPVAFLTAAVDSVAPVLRIKALKGMAGGGAALQMPVPMNLRQRRRAAFIWIMEAAAKRADRGLRNRRANKIADELIAVVEGKSGVWERRQGLHKSGVAARSNLKPKRGRR